MMLVELGKRYRFEAAHRLPHVPHDHKCFRLHGHSFEVEICVTGEVDPGTGWLVDFGQVTAVVEPILKAELDHRTLNDVPGLENPTSEMLCLWLWRRLLPDLPMLSAVTVHETCAARCTYRGD
jgi:6-pyruvoyl tetrahydropterin synthase/QueD family protein